MPSRARTSSPDRQPCRGTHGQVQGGRYPPADGHAAEHVDRQALTGDHGGQDGQGQDGLDQPLDAPGKIGQPGGGDTHRDGDVKHRKAQVVTGEVDRVRPPASGPQDQDQRSRSRPASRPPRSPDPAARPSAAVRQPAAAPPRCRTTRRSRRQSISHRSPCGGGLSTPAMTSSGRELDCSARTAHNVARIATASRTPSDPRRRRWPSPSGAKTTERQSRTAGLASVTGRPVTERLLTATAHQPATWPYPSAGDAVRW